jgi:predicted transglutaminase-like cysteine proteinase
MINKSVRLCMSLSLLALATACASTQSYAPAYGPTQASAKTAATPIPASRANVLPAQAVRQDVVQASWLNQTTVPLNQTPTYVPNVAANVGVSTRPLALRTISRPIGTSMGIGPRDLAPEGLQEFCDRLTAECGVEHRFYQRQTPSGFVLANSGNQVRTVRSRPARALAPVAWTSQTRKLVGAVNRQVNRSMIGSTDAQAFGRYEYWAMPISDPDTRQGRGRPLADCEDFALEKRRALITAGVPEEALYLAVAHTARTGMHAVLVIATDEGDMVLDNLNDWLTEWSKTGYVWIKRQSSTSLLDWAIAGRASSPVDYIHTVPNSNSNDRELFTASGRQIAQNAVSPRVSAAPATTLVSIQGLRGSNYNAPNPLTERSIGQEQATSHVLSLDAAKAAARRISNIDRGQKTAAGPAKQALAQARELHGKINVASYSGDKVTAKAAPSKIMMSLNATKLGVDQGKAVTIFAIKSELSTNAKEIVFGLNLAPAASTEAPWSGFAAFDSSRPYQLVGFWNQFLLHAREDDRVSSLN